MHEGLDRERAAIDLDHPFLVHDRAGVAVRHADRRPVALLAGEPARMMAARLAARDVLEEGVDRARELEGLHREVGDAAAVGGRRLEREPDEARRRAGQVDVAALRRPPLRPRGRSSTRRRRSRSRRERHVVPRRDATATTRPPYSRSSPKSTSSQMRRRRPARSASSSRGRRRARARVRCPAGRSRRAPAASRGTCGPRGAGRRSTRCPRRRGRRAITSSIAPSSASAPPPAGPHANSISRLRTRSVCQSAGKSKASQCRHQTLRPLGSASFSSRRFARRRAADREAERVALRHRPRQRLARDDEAAAALEVEVEAHDRAPRARAPARCAARRAPRRPASSPTGPRSRPVSYSAWRSSVRSPYAHTAGSVLRTPTDERGDSRPGAVARGGAQPPDGGAPRTRDPQLRDLRGRRPRRGARRLLLALLLAINGLNVVNSYVGRDFMTAHRAARRPRLPPAGAALRRGLRGLDRRGGPLPLHARSGSASSGATGSRATGRRLPRRTALLSAGGRGQAHQPRPAHRRRRAVVHDQHALARPSSSSTARSPSSPSPGVLWSISRLLFVVAVGYAALGSLLAVVLGRPLVRLNYDQSDREADFRAELVHVRENAESVALLHREPTSRRGSAPARRRAHRQPPADHRREPQPRLLHHRLQLPDPAHPGADRGAALHPRHGGVRRDPAVVDGVRARCSARSRWW